MTKKTSKVVKGTGNKPDWWQNLLAIVSIVVALVCLLVTVFYYQPKVERLEDIYYNFAVVEDYYEVVEIAEAIPLPSPLGPIENLDYSPITVYEVAPDAEKVDFRGSSYGYILQLSTGLNTYLATSDPEYFSEWHVVYTIGELREDRLKLRWFIYNGPIPPEEWIQKSE